ncbi:MAG: roadblock/LC7 domain-containing protein [Thioalkalispiraceae bacterium]|jgi:predicted regulator of Ras-like GTPase activity (Roadblock/LC7/MglB family)
MQIINEVIDQISTSHNEKDPQLQKILIEEFDKLLDSMLSHTEDISAAIISSVDGLAQAQKLDSDMDEQRFAAMSSALLALSDNLADEGKKGRTDNVLIEGSNGKIFIMHAGPNYLLTVFTRDNANLGMSLAFAKQAIEQIEALLEIIE